MSIYEKINKHLKQHEAYKPYCEWTLDKIADYIDWAWKFRKITERQKDEVCERIITLFEREV